jgi:hypothetical protein
MKSTNTRILDGKWRLDALGARSFPWALLVLLLAAMLVAWRSRPWLSSGSPHPAPVSPHDDGRGRRRA